MDTKIIVSVLLMPLTFATISLSFLHHDIDQQISPQKNSSPIYFCEKQLRIYDIDIDNITFMPIKFL